jgi:hypothetical protein
VNPEHDPAIADENADPVQPDEAAGTGTELETRPDLSPEIVTSHRAGSIVTEFVSAIVEEAQERAIEMIQAAAEKNDAGQREALASADRMRARIDAMSEELESAAEQLRKESERLAALHEQTMVAAATGRTVAALGAGEPEPRDEAAGAEADEPAAADPAYEPPQPDEPDDEGPHEVEVVHVHHEDEGASGADDYEVAVDADVEDDHTDATLAEERADAEPTLFEAPAEPEAPAAEEAGLTEEFQAVAEPEAVAEEEPEALAEEEPEAVTEAVAEPELDAEPDDPELAEFHAAFAQMSDGDLALAYTRTMATVNEMSEGTLTGKRRLRYAGAALGEALTRASFADVGQGPPPLEPVPRMGRRRKQRAEAINTLRLACAETIETEANNDPLGLARPRERG